jgi:ubiquitin C-terminal hydrolase
MEKKKHNLEDLLALYAKHEKLTNDDMWKCPHCMKLVDAIKQLCIYETGPVVIIQLKRFVEGKARRLIKRTDVVLFEESMQFTNGGPMYDLISVIYHKGTLHGGHYAAACRTPSGASWMLYDDAKSKPLATPDFDAAYVLCYALRKFRWSPKYECLMPSSTKIVVNAILVLHKRKDSVLSMLCLNVWKIIFGYLE